MWQQTERRKPTNEEIEVGWLPLSDNSRLVLTRRHVLQQQDHGIFGESRAIIPRKAITAVRLTWRRSRGVIALGSILLLCYLALLLGGMIIEPGGISLSARVFNMSSPTMTAIQYGLLIAGVGLLLLFWFYKRYEIQIMAPGVTLGGTPASYEDAERFSVMLVSGTRTPPQGAEQTEHPAEASAPRSDPDWQL